MPDPIEKAKRFVITPLFESRTISKSILVIDCMTANPLTTRSQETVFGAAVTMVENGVPGLPVVDAAGSVEGIVTLSDLLYRLKTPHGTVADAIRDWLGQGSTELQKTLATTVAEAMTKPVHTIEASDTIAAAASRMLSEHVHLLPVLSAGGLVGVISRRDIVKALIDAARQEEPTEQPGISSPKRLP